MTKPWFNYIIFDNVKTYVGSTVNLDRRIRQHNCDIKGGAKYTRGGNWQYYCVIYNLYNDKNKCLSEEWHLKWETGKVKGAKSTYERRKIAIENYIPKDPYEYKYVIFLSRQYLHLMPICNSSVFIYIIDDFSQENILSHLLMFRKLTKSQMFKKSMIDRIKNVLRLKYKI